MTHIILVRHGQTAWNEGEGERLQGRADLDLSEIEKNRLSQQQQSSHVASHQPAAIYSSPLRRAMNTARNNITQRYMPSQIPIMNIKELLNRLESEYGPRHWESRQDALSVLIETILSQNTSDTNSHRAFNSLLATFGNWETVAHANAEDIAHSIEQGGLSKIKAQRIKNVLEHIHQERGDYSIDFLACLSLPEAKMWLRKMPGVGPKTAGCVLLFGLGMPAMPVDTHVFRVTKRLGLIGSRIPVDQAHDILESLILPEKVYSCHLHLIEHGRRVCRAQNPRCHQCMLVEICAYQISQATPSESTKSQDIKISQSPTG